MYIYLYLCIYIYMYVCIYRIYTVDFLYLIKTISIVFL